MPDFLPIVSLAVAVAFTVLPIVATVGILVDSGRASRAWMLTIGYAAGIAALFAAATAGLVRLSLPKLAHPAVIEVGAGIALLLVVVVMTVLRRKGAARHQHPRSAADHRPISRAKAALLGLQFVFHPENLILIAAAAAKAANFGEADRAIAVVVFTVVSVSTVALPAAAYAIWGERVRPTLERVKHWFTVNDRRLAIGALTIIGLILVAAGVWGMLR
jgi:hypothetical protein